MKKIAYARVSTSGQTLETQIAQLGAEGCAQIFRETASGAKSDRPELAKALAALSLGDVFVVTRLDRLARSTFDLLQTVRVIEARGAKREVRRLGRPPLLSAHQRGLIAQWRAEGQDNAQIARALGVSRSTVSRVT